MKISPPPVLLPRPARGRFTISSLFIDARPIGRYVPRISIAPCLVKGRGSCVVGDPYPHLASQIALPTSAPPTFVIGRPLSSHFLAFDDLTYFEADAEQLIMLEKQSSRTRAMEEPSKIDPVLSQTTRGLPRVAYWGLLMISVSIWLPVSSVLSACYCLEEPRVA